MAQRSKKTGSSDKSQALKYLPKIPVRYPEPWRYACIVVLWSKSCSAPCWLLCTVWLWA